MNFAQRTVSVSGTTPCRLDKGAGERGLGPKLAEAASDDTAMAEKKRPMKPIINALFGDVRVALSLGVPLML